ncbi:MAG TPA: hypothetical protein VK929_10830 [Longimicrobiales bacterium]|nr:hypothetical protein [Longimicrobiales bacterium]
MPIPTRRVSPLLLLPVCLATLQACGGADSPDLVVRTDSAGITIVSNGGADLPPPIVLHEDFRLGGDDSRPEHAFYQVNAGNIGVDDAGNIHVLDASSHRVVSFDGQGRHLRTVGGRGGGPGEMGMPFGLVVEPDGAVGVVDISKRALVRFGPDGSVLEQQPLPEGYRGGNLVAYAGGMIAPSSRADDGRMVSTVVHTTAADSRELVDMTMAEMKPVQLASCGMGFSGMPPVFSPSLRWAANGDRLVVVRSDGYDIEVFDDGVPTFRIRRDMAPTPATTALAVQEQGEGMRVGTEGGYRVCEPQEVVEQLGVAPTIPAIGQLAVAPDGSIAVRRGGVRDTPRAIDLFAADGEYLGTLPPGSPFPLAFLPDGRIAAADTDALDVTRLVVYRVDWRDNVKSGEGGG